MKEGLLSIFIGLLWIVGVIGWIINLFLFINLNFKAPYKAEVIRGIGVFTPLGGIIGYINIED